jgi:hypothetical protein
MHDASNLQLQTRIIFVGVPTRSALIDIMHDGRSISGFERACCHQPLSIGGTSTRVSVRYTNISGMQHGGEK